VYVRGRGRVLVVRKTDNETRQQSRPGRRGINYAAQGVRFVFRTRGDAKWMHRRDLFVLPGRVVVAVAVASQNAAGWGPRGFGIHGSRQSDAWRGWIRSPWLAAVAHRVGFVRLMAGVDDRRREAGVLTMSFAPSWQNSVDPPFLIIGMRGGWRRLTTLNATPLRFTSLPPRLRAVDGVLTSR